MAKPMYLWRTLTREQQLELAFRRRQENRPWHSPPHRPNIGHNRFHITAACFEHAPYIGLSPERMDTFSRDLLAACAPLINKMFAWCVLPNHYHMLAEVPDVLALLGELGRLHGRTSYYWNGQEQTRGRQVFYRAVERAIRSDRHYWATLNYVHHNPVHHRYVTLWPDWPWSSAAEYLAQAGTAEASRLWKEFPILDYGQGWDDAEL